MIGKFFDALFDYADELKAQGKMVEYRTVHAVEDILQKAYDDGVSASSVINGYKGKSEMERLILSIPDITVYKDKNDGMVWYELDLEYDTHGAKRRFDTPQEVVKHLISYRTKKVKDNIGAEKKYMLQVMMSRLNKLNSNDVFGNPKEIIYTDKENEDEGNV